MPVPGGIMSAVLPCGGAAVLLPEEWEIWRTKEMEKRIWTRIVSVVMSLAVVVTMLPTTAVALTVKNDASTIGIYTAEDLHAIRNNLSGKYKLMNDIDLASWGNWTPIGGAFYIEGESFCGELDGNGYAILNMQVFFDDSDDEFFGGLFGCCTGASIHDIIVKNCRIEVNAQYATVGGITGYSDCAIETAEVSGTIIAKGASSCIVGGIAGEGVSFSNCNNYASITEAGTCASQKAYAGGISSTACGMVSHCNNYGSVTTKGFSGGIVAVLSGNLQDGEVSDCYNYGNITSDQIAGGIVGTVENTSITNSQNVASIQISSNGSPEGHYAGGIAGKATNSPITNCKNNGMVACKSGGAFAGGIVGNISDTEAIMFCSNYEDVSATGNTRNYNSFAGGIVGVASNTSVSESYNTGDITASAKYGGSFSSGDGAWAMAGGIAGSFVSAEILNSYNTGKIVSATAWTNGGPTWYTGEGFPVSGGIAGQSTGNIAFCYSTGYAIVNEFSVYCGGIIGLLSENGKASSCYYQIPGNRIGCGTVQGIEASVCGVSLEEMEFPETFANFDFSGVWMFDESHPYPSLINNKHQGK